MLTTTSSSRMSSVQWLIESRPAESGLGAAIAATVEPATPRVN
jgi:hypothetical protein